MTATVTAVDLLNKADSLAPVPATRDDATNHAWVRYYAAQGLAAYAALRHEHRSLTPNPNPGSRPDLGYLAIIGQTSVAAAVALLGPLNAPSLIWELTPEAGSLNGEYEEWLTDVLVRYGINPADIDPDLNPADFTTEDTATRQINAFQTERSGEQVTA